MVDKFTSHQRTFACLLLIVLCRCAWAEPFIEPGDLWLRHDLQLLSDEGVISTPVTAWPMSVGDIAASVSRVNRGDDFSLQVSAALRRVRSYLAEHQQLRAIAWELDASLSERPQRILSFSRTPRGQQQVSLGASYVGNRFAAKIVAGLQSGDDVDDQTFRLDGSYASVVLGNWIVSAGAQERFWGPGWNSSLMLSNNARPIPALTLQRNFSTPFNNRLLSWLGSWSTSVIWGQLENDRAVPNTRVFAWRVNARPTRDIEFGLQRTVQWCGSGRDCSADAFLNALAGNSNLDEGVENDVANQLAGFDFRWTSPVGTLPYAFYGQLIGEDEAGGFPSKYIGQVGMEVWGESAWLTSSWRAYLEYSDTSCQFYQSEPDFNCAYNNGSYPNGFRFRDRAIGHSSDNDSQSLAFSVMGRSGRHDWSLRVRHMKLNRDGAPDLANTLTSVAVDQSDVDVLYRTYMSNGARLSVQAGVVSRDAASAKSTTDFRASVGVTFSSKSWGL